ncbi:MAG TPA: universal stress protein [Acidimicrobiales bacterium]|jgi:nucleotide-binding universal stress UspA family protein|nr:universal stress protein [Acidimicrobiales bacterium]
MSSVSQSDGGGRIVVGFDGSPSSLDALSWAARQAELTSASVEVVMCWEWPSSYGWALPVPEDFDPEGDIHRTLETALTPLRTAHPQVAIDGRVVEGHPAPVLVEASKAADLLVVGNRGHGEFVGMVIGSVSEHCAANAHCPVLVHRTA